MKYTFHELIGLVHTHTHMSIKGQLIRELIRDVGLKLSKLLLPVSGVVLWEVLLTVQLWVCGREERYYNPRMHNV